MAEAASKNIQLKIDRLTYGPDAIARDEDGRAIFVQGAIPGDTVEAEIYEEGQRFAKAKTVRILEASPDRVKAPCPFVGICGGCPGQYQVRGPARGQKGSCRGCACPHRAHPPGPS